MKYFPIFLKVEGRSLVVFGGGADAAAKLRLLQKTEARIYVVSEHLETDVLDLREAIWVQMDPLAYDLPTDTALIYAATGDEALDRELVQKAQARSIPACAVDQIGPSDFTTPALVDRDPVVVAIGTEGAAPTLARDIKASVNRLLEPNLGAIAKTAHALRPKVAHETFPGPQRRAFWQGFFDKARKQPGQADKIAQDLLNEMERPQPNLSFIDAPKSPKNLSSEARSVLHDADVVIFDKGVPSSILELARREALQINQDNLRHEQVAQAFQVNQHVVLIRSKQGRDDLSDLAAGFGILAKVFPATSQENVLPFNLAEAA